jgi:hypothetical protein
MKSASFAKAILTTLSWRPWCMLISTAPTSKLNEFNPSSHFMEAMPVPMGEDGKVSVVGASLFVKRGGLQAVGALREDIDLLVIHVDADILLDAEHDARNPCPPPDGNILAAEAIVMQWLGITSLPEKVLIWVPSMATEAWLLRAVFPGLPESVSCLISPPPSVCVECLEDPAKALEGKSPRFVRRKGKDLKKIAIAYRGANPLVSKAWGDLAGSVWSAGRLQKGLSRWIPVAA